MKKIISLIGILIFSFSLSLASQASASTTSKQVEWQAYSPGVFDQAKSAHRHIFLFADSSACHWCQKMEKTTLNDAAVIKLINDNYLPVKLDVDNNADAVNLYQITTLPTMMVFDESGKSMVVLTGYKTVSELTGSLRRFSK